MKPRPIGTRFTQYCGSYTRDALGNEVGYERHEYPYEVIGHDIDFLGREIELLKPIRNGDE